MGVELVRGLHLPAGRDGDVGDGEGLAAGLAVEQLDGDDVGVAGLGGQLEADRVGELGAGLAGQHLDRLGVAGGGRGEPEQRQEQRGEHGEQTIRHCEKLRPVREGEAAAAYPSATFQRR
ncbi:hypothetical protein SD80_010980 [Scytonema tolypothrichoides VB-61278]|nr:hypothetical protein SD80_010980 [Scytonema tolypothrichoides VB-61278]